MNPSVEILMKERDRLLEQQTAIHDEFENKIIQLEESIEKLSGGKIIFNNLGEAKYDDESPDYIKGTEDGI